MFLWRKAYIRSFSHFILFPKQLQEGRYPCLVPNGNGVEATWVTALGRRSPRENQALRPDPPARPSLGLPPFTAGSSSHRRPTNRHSSASNEIQPEAGQVKLVANQTCQGGAAEGPSRVFPSLERARRGRRAQVSVVRASAARAASPERSALGVAAPVPFWFYCSLAHRDPGAGLGQGREPRDSAWRWVRIGRPGWRADGLGRRLGRAIRLTRGQGGARQGAKASSGAACPRPLLPDIPPDCLPPGRRHSSPFSCGSFLTLSPFVALAPSLSSLPFRLVYWPALPLRLASTRLDERLQTPSIWLCRLYHLTCPHQLCPFSLPSASTQHPHHNSSQALLPISSQGFPSWPP